MPIVTVPPDEATSRCGGAKDETTLSVSGA
jgi:hypothetical protein